VATGKLAELKPEGIEMLAGTVATAELELDRVTVSPPEPAGAVRVTVPVDEIPPVTVAGLAVSEFKAGTACAGFTVRAVDLLIPLKVAVRVADIAEDTDPVVRVNEADVDPWGTVRLGGTGAAVEFELASVTVAPPEGAAAVSVTVTVDGWPLVTDAGFATMLLRATAGRLTVRPKPWLTPLSEAVIVSEVELETATGVAPKVVEVAPWGTMTLVGMVTAAAADDNPTVVPPTGAAEVSATVQVETAGAARVVGIQDRPFNPG
jgi:hypothetical protein